MHDVTIGCVCPGTPHESDTIGLLDPLPFARAIALRQAIAAGGSVDSSLPMIEGYLFEAYIRYTVGAWSLVDERGKPWPTSGDNLAAFMAEHPIEAAAVADKADDLYGAKVVLPLVMAASGSSPATPTASSTSPTPGSARSRKRSSPSSITSIPTAATATTSSAPDGGSSTSRKSA